MNYWTALNTVSTFIILIHENFSFQKTWASFKNTQKSFTGKNSRSGLVSKKNKGDGAWFVICQYHRTTTLTILQTKFYVKYIIHHLTLLLAWFKTWSWGFIRQKRHIECFQTTPISTWRLFIALFLFLAIIIILINVYLSVALMHVILKKKIQQLCTG